MRIDSARRIRVVHNQRPAFYVFRFVPGQLRGEVFTFLAVFFWDHASVVESITPHLDRFHYFYLLGLNPAKANILACINYIPPRRPNKKNPPSEFVYKIELKRIFSLSTRFIHRISTRTELEISKSVQITG